MAGDDIELRERFRRPADPVLVTCRHPSTEPEAVAGELLAARAEGVRLVHHGGAGQQRRASRPVDRPRSEPPRHPGGARAGLGAGAGATRRWRPSSTCCGGRPATTAPSPGWPPLPAVLGAARAWPPSATTSQPWRPRPRRPTWPSPSGSGGSATWSPADRRRCSLDAVVAFLDRLAAPGRARPVGAPRRACSPASTTATCTPDPWRAPAGAGDREAVTVTTIAGAAGGSGTRSSSPAAWRVSCPASAGRAPLFDPRRRRPAEAGRRRWPRSAGGSPPPARRATARLVATAAPEPGVLLSRFVEGLGPPGREAAGVPGAGAGLPPRHRQQPRRVPRAASCTLSASQLATYDDCPLRYAYQYGAPGQGRCRPGHDPRHVRPRGAGRVPRPRRARASTAARRCWPSPPSAGATTSPATGPRSRSAGATTTPCSRPGGPARASAGPRRC